MTWFDIEGEPVTDPDLIAQLDQVAGATVTWIRQAPRSKLDEWTLPWHREDEPGPNGLIRAACGTTFSNPDAVERRDDTPDAGDRCPTCSAWRP